MKKLIQIAGNYKLFAELRTVELMPGTNVLQFSTTYDDSRFPEQEQVKLQLVLSDQDLQTFKDLLNEH